MKSGATMNNDEQSLAMIEDYAQKDMELRARAFYYRLGDTIKALLIALIGAAAIHYLLRTKE